MKWDIRKLAKRILPNWVAEIIRVLITKYNFRKFKKLSTQQVFTKIYKENFWGKPTSKKDFYSGPGSHDSILVNGYVNSVKNFLRKFDKKVKLVDLGCGDFAVGLQIYPFCKEYIACDIVESLIKRNQEKFKGTDVDFRVLNIIEDPLPKGDVVCLRQVLQHLSNQDIQKIIPKLEQYRYLIFTECLPKDHFIANIDIITGPSTRFCIDSGVELTSPPFNLSVKKNDIIYQYDTHDSRYQTRLYQFF